MQDVRDRHRGSARDLRFKRNGGSKYSSVSSDTESRVVDEGILVHHRRAWPSRADEQEEAREIDSRSESTRGLIQIIVKLEVRSI
jgi:hypothetical protein